MLTDGGIYLGKRGEFKRFDIQDGLGMGLLRRAGIQLGWVSSRPSTATKQRAEDLKVDFLHQSRGPKVAAVEAILSRAGVDWAELAYAGDDLVDLGVMVRAGVALAVSNAAPEVCRAAHYVTRRPGGGGAIREMAELILKAQKRWGPLVAEYSA